MAKLLDKKSGKPITQSQREFSDEEKLTTKQKVEYIEKISRVLESDNENKTQPEQQHTSATEKIKQHDGSALNQITVGDIVKKLYKTNPFYLISACLVLYASTRLFHTDNVFIDNLVPLAIMGVYTAILAGTAVFIARIGKVWDDAGTLLQINLMLFMAISVGLDGKIINDTTVGIGWVVAGLAVMLAISEVMFNGLKLKLPKIFRVAYYSLMGCYFSYPWVLAELVTVYGKNKLPAIWGMLLFPVIGGILFVILLVPMIRCGQDLFAKLGAPWEDIRFPGSLFILMLLGFGFRTYLNTISFYGGRGVGPYSAMQTGFELFMLLPLVAAVAIILLEYGKVRENKKCIQIAMLLPVIIFVITLLGVFSKGKFNSNLFLKAIGNFELPLYAALISIMLIYFYGWYKKIRGAALLTGISAFVGAFSLYYTYKATEQLNATSVVLVAAVLLISLIIITLIVIRKNITLGIIWGMIQAIISLWVLFPDLWIFNSYHGGIPLTVIYLTLLICSVFIRDDWGKVLRLITAVVMPVLCLIATVYGVREGTLVMQFICMGYAFMLLVVIAILAVYGKYLLFFICGAIGMIVIICFGMLMLYGELGSAGGRAMFWAIIFFITAFLISMAKGKMYHKCGERVQQIFR
jgi:hypothetical protein